MTIRILLYSLLLPGLTNFVLATESMRINLDPDLFPIPTNLVENINFWISVFGEYTQDQAILHDTQDLGIIYEIIDVNNSFGDTLITPEAMSQKIRATRNEYRLILAKLARVRPVDLAGLSAKEQRIYQLFKGQHSARRFQLASGNIRLQFGLREEFLFGIIRSGRYIDEMQRIFRKYDLPEELVYLPHVESSFQTRIYSRVGAAGMWQFTKKTGQRLLSIDSFVDERLDPFYATEAAAKLLKENYQQLGSWPLAITAYNHGVNGMLRAKKMVGTSDFGTILQKYHSRSFRFASRNFYAEFIAAVHVRTNYQKYFGEVILAEPFEFTYLRIPSALTIQEFAQTLELNFDILQQYNPAIHHSVFQYQPELPRGFRIRVPERSGVDLADMYTQLIHLDEQAAPQSNTKPFINEEIAVHHPEDNNSSPLMPITEQNILLQNHQNGELLSIDKNENRQPESARSQPNSSATYQTLPVPVPPNPEVITVRPDETLGHYAEWLEVPTQTLRRLNNLRYGRDIYIGRKLKLTFKNVTPALFYQRRAAYHENIENSYYEIYMVTGVRIHQMQPGENIWSLCNEVYQIPYWLLLKYNAHLKLQKLKTGDEVIFPLVSAKNINSSDSES